MSTTQQTIDLHRDYVMSTYAPGLVLSRGKGTRVWDGDGREYLDFIGGIAVISIGHAHHRLVKAIRKQAGRLMHVSNLYFNENQPRLAERLSRLSLGGKVFFCNSGAEANEGLIKLARLWGHDAGKYEVVTMRNSFHGRTLATLTATGQDKVQKGFEPLPQGFRYAGFNDLESCRAAVTPRTAAILVEAVQGEGGVLPGDPAFMTGLQELCREKDVLLLFDEVQTGMGRTGRWFGYQHFGVEPDAISLAKGLGGGFPIGAVVSGRRLSDVFQPGKHATTFGGTPLACAAALAVADVIEENHLVERAEKLGAYLKSQLTRMATRYSFIREVRGLGLLLGLALDRPAKPLELALRERGVLTLATADTVLRLAPPLTVRKSEIIRFLKALDGACQSTQSEKETP